MTAVQPPAALARCELDGRSSRRLSREAAGRRRLDQRRLLRAVARASSTTSKGDETTWERGAAGTLAARRQLAAPSSTTASGSRWTRCATSTQLEELWASGKAPWKVWAMNAELLDAAARLPHRPYRLQGRLARALAERPRRAGPRATRWPPPTVPSLFDGRRGSTTRCRSRRWRRARSRPARARDAELRAGGRLPPGGAAAGARLLRASRSRPSTTNVMGTVNVLEAVRAHARPCGRSSSSPATSATRTGNGSGPIAKSTRSAATIPTRAARRCAEMVAASYGRVLLRRRRRIGRSRPLGPAMSSAAATGRRIGWSPISSARSPTGKAPRIRNPASVPPLAARARAAVRLSAACRALFAEAPAFADAWNFGPAADAVQSVGRRRSRRRDLGAGPV